MGTTSSLPSLERLRRVPGFEACPTPELLIISSVVEPTTVSVGTMLASGDAPLERMLVLASGTVLLAAGPCRLEHLGPGDLIGTREAVTRAEHEVTAVATTDVELLAVVPDGIPRFLSCPAVRRLVARSEGRIAVPSIAVAGGPLGGRLQPASASGT